MPRTISVVLLSFILLGSATAQTVRTNAASSLGSLYKSADKAAEQQGISYWPQTADGDLGTQVHLTFWFKDCDIYIRTTKDTSVEALLAKSKSIVAALDMPEADYRTQSALYSNTVDIEFHDYLSKGNRRSDFTWDLARLKSAMEAANLPKPVAVCLHADADGDDHAILKDGGRSEEIRGERFFKLSDLPSSGTLSFHAEIQWFAYPVLAVLCLFFGGVIIYAFSTVIRSILKPPSDSPKKLTSDEVQAAYDKASKRGLGKAITYLPMLPLLFMMLPGKKVVGQALLLLPEPSPETFSYIIFAPVVLLVPTFAAALVIRKRRQRVQPSEERDFAKELEPFKRTMLWLFVLMFLIPFMSMPAFRQLRPEARISILFLVLAISFSGGAISHVRANRRTSKVLSGEDPLYLAAKSIADSAGLAFRSLRIKESSSANAFADLIGNVTVTSKLLKLLEPEEIRAILAHELKHVWTRDVLKIFVPSIALTALYVPLRLYVGSKLSSELASFIGFFFLWFVLPFVNRLIFTPRMRRNEYAADLFALQTVKDPEIVISALRKVHEANQTPARLRPAHEKMSSHPSLENRIAAIRRAAERDAATNPNESTEQPVHL